MARTGGGRLDEFGRIKALFRPLAAGCPGALDLTDDAAFLAPEAGYDTVLTMDTMVEGVHFLPEDPAQTLARKLVAVNFSDLAAKGAEPRHVMLSAALPKRLDDVWLRDFAKGLRLSLHSRGVALIGGDTVSTPGPLTLTLTAFGCVESGQGLLRSGARAGDDIWVSGTLGDGALGLRVLRGEGGGLSPRHQAFLTRRYRCPTPRLDLGRALVGLASACMDVSDGLVQDLGHLCRASKAGAEIHADLLPLSPAFRAELKRDKSLLALAATGGDDYELLFTVPPARAEMILERAPVPITRIGRMAGRRPDVVMLDEQGRAVEMPQGGWNHFSGADTVGGKG